jgi:UDP-N-acetylglucosamine transferase subunit ALG13
VPTIDKGFKRFEYDMERISVFVTVGTNHYDFSRMLKLEDSCLSLLAIPFDLTLQYGFCEQVKEYPNCTSAKMFSREQAEQYYASSDLIFSHCGIGSIYNSLNFNRPTVIIPRLAKFNEFSDDHQLQIAREITVNPLVYMIEERVDPKVFISFFERNLKQPKIQKDLTNHKLAKFIKSRLLA